MTKYLTHKEVRDTSPPVSFRLHSKTESKFGGGDCDDITGKDLTNAPEESDPELSCLCASLSTDTVPGLSGVCWKDSANSGLNLCGRASLSKIPVKVSHNNLCYPTKSPRGIRRFTLDSDTFRDHLFTATLSEIIKAWEEAFQIVEPGETDEFDLDEKPMTIIYGCHQKIVEAKDVTKKKLAEMLQGLVCEQNDITSAQTMLVNEIKKAEEKKIAIEIKNRKLELEKEEFKKQLKLEKAETDKMKKSITAKDEEITKLKQESYKLKKSSAKYCETIEKRKADVMKLEGDISTLKADYDKLKKLMQSSSDVNSKTENNFKHQMAAMTKELEDAKKREKELKAKKDEDNAALCNAKEELMMANQKLEMVNEELDRLQISAAETEEELKRVEGLYKEAKALAEIKVSPRRSSHDHSKAHEKMVEALRRDADELDKERKKLQEKIKALYEWDEELKLREDRLANVLEINKIKEQLVRLLKTREKRMSRPSEFNYESMRRIVNKYKKEVVDLKCELKQREQELSKRSSDSDSRSLKRSIKKKSTEKRKS